MMSIMESERTERDVVQYSPPTLTNFGTIEALTLTATSGSAADALGGLGPPDGTHS